MVRVFSRARSAVESTALRMNAARRQALQDRLSQAEASLRGLNESRLFLEEFLAGTRTLADAGPGVDNCALRLARRLQQRQSNVTASDLRVSGRKADLGVSKALRDRDLISAETLRRTRLKLRKYQTTQGSWRVANAKTARAVAGAEARAATEAIRSQIFSFQQQALQAEQTAADLRARLGTH